MVEILASLAEMTDPCVSLIRMLKQTINLCFRRNRLPNNTPTANPNCTLYLRSYKQTLLVPNH